MKKYWRYMSYVIRHKWYVFLEASKLGIPWLGLIHDYSKLLPSEFVPYARHFYGAKMSKGIRDEAFDWAWLLHQKRNRHHWQWWVLPYDDGGARVLEMPLRYRKEMLADWRGAGMATGHPDTRAWYLKNRERQMLADDTRAWIDARLGKGMK